MIALIEMVLSGGTLATLASLWSWALASGFTWLALWLMIQVAPVFLPLGVTDTPGFRQLKGFLESKVVRVVVTVIVGTFIWFIL